MEVVTNVCCPFCGKELTPWDRTVDYRVVVYACTNPECEESEDLIGTIELWSHLVIVAEEMKKACKNGGPTV